MKLLFHYTLAVFAVFAVVPALAGETVEQWGVYELTLEGPEAGNPFLDVELKATFSDGSREFDVRGFYDGEGRYKVRFMPDRTGEWTYQTRSNRWPLTNETGSFTVSAPSEGNHGPVHVAETWHFAYADGTPYFPFGTTAYNWLHRPAGTQQDTLDTLRENAFNKLRMLIFPEGKGSRTPPARFPFEGEPPSDWDFSRFNPEFFQAIEKRIRQLGELGVEADVILFHKYGSEWGFDTMPDHVDDRYLEYIVARFAAFRNVWWSVANEFDFVKTKTMADWDRYFEVIQREDPYGRLRSIHNGFLLYDNNKPWVTHASIQNGAAVEESGRAQIYRDVWRKPVVYDEVKYEGNISRRWGQLSGEEMVHRFWAGTVAGTYVGHGECYLSDDKIVWLSTGGVLRGTSPPRIAFLRRIVEEMPGYIEPVDKWQDTRTGGVPGEAYLVYFGREEPESWPFGLPDSGVNEDQAYRVEIIDTWEMTITPVDGAFHPVRKDRYRFVAKDGRVVALPGKPGIALRVIRIEGEASEVKEEDPNL